MTEREKRGRRGKGGKKGWWEVEQGEGEFMGRRFRRTEKMISYRYN